MMPELTVIMPVYNEEGAISSVLRQWTEALQALSIDYQIVVYNDGSKDGTLTAVKTILPKNQRVIVIDKANSGHGPTILQGYNGYLDSAWIFQIDSDGELGPEKFRAMWNKRQDYDLLIGNRIQRNSPLPRRIITWFSRYLVWGVYGRAVYDVNCPYRLFRPERFKDFLSRIPLDTFAPNLIIAGIAAHVQLRVFQIDIVHTARETGEVSIRRWKLLRAALASCMQTIAFRWELRKDRSSCGSVDCGESQ